MVSIYETLSLSWQRCHIGDINYLDGVLQNLGEMCAKLVRNHVAAWQDE